MTVTFGELTEANPESETKDVVMSAGNYYKLSNNGTLNVLRRGGGGLPALVEYESLPARFKTRFKEIWGDPYKEVESSMMENDIVIDSKARTFYDEHKLADDTHIPDVFQKEYVMNASVLNLLDKMLMNLRAQRKAKQGSMSTVWAAVMTTLEKLRYYEKENGEIEARVRHTLPRSEARFRSTLNAYKKDGYATLISGKLGNSNTVKITPEAGLWLIVKKRQRVPFIFTNKQIWKEYNRVAPKRGWKQLEEQSSVTSFLNRPEVVQQWYDAVHGELKAHQKFGYKFKTIMPEFRDAIWYGDGTKLNLYYKHWDGSKWVMKTTMVYEVMDAYSEVLLGYHISDSENYEAQYNAYRMAVERAESKPFEIVVDNQSSYKKLQSFYDRICRLHRTTTPYRPTGKSIEQVFGRFQREVLHQDWRFTGQNITAKSEESRPNLEFVLVNTDSLYTLDELKIKYAEMREQWNNELHPDTDKPRIEMYNESVNERTEKVSKVDMMEMFWLMTSRPATFTSSGLQIQIDKQKQTYDVYDGAMPDLNFRSKNINRKFFTQYDPKDLTLVRLYKEGASGLEYVTDAEPYFEVQRAAQEATTESSSMIRSVMNLEKQLRIDKYFADMKLEFAHDVAPEQHGLNRPKPKGIGKKALEEIAIANGEVMIPKKKKSSAPKKVKKEVALVDYDREYETVSMGQYNKDISNMTYDEIEFLDEL